MSLGFIGNRYIKPYSRPWLCNILFKSKISSIIDDDTKTEGEGVEITSEEEGSDEDNHDGQRQERKYGKHFAQWIIFQIFYVG